MIRRNVAIEARFVDDLLDVTRITRGKLEIVPEDIDLHEVVAHAVEIARPDADAKSQGVSVSLDAGESRLRGDKARLQQMLWNVIKNASKFTPTGGQIAVETRNEDGRIVIDVTDDGIGIEPEALGRIFDPFEQADGSVAREFGGLGLGLAIAKATVDAHEGTILARSAGRGKGATLTIELPLKVRTDPKKAS
jgi:two-component system CheB/CheR fusion protein